METKRLSEARDLSTGLWIGGHMHRLLSDVVINRVPFPSSESHFGIINCRISQLWTKRRRAPGGGESKGRFRVSERHFSLEMEQNGVVVRVRGLGQRYRASQDGGSIM